MRRTLWVLWVLLVSGLAIIGCKSKTDDAEKTEESERSEPSTDVEGTDKPDGNEDPVATGGPDTTPAEPDQTAAATADEGPAGPDPFAAVTSDNACNWIHVDLAEGEKLCEKFVSGNDGLACVDRPGVSIGQAGAKAQTFYVHMDMLDAEQAYVGVEYGGGWDVSPVGMAIDSAESYTGESVEIKEVKFADVTGEGTPELLITWELSLWEGDPDTGDQDRRSLTVQAMASLWKGTGTRWIRAVPFRLTQEAGKIPNDDIPAESKVETWASSLVWTPEGLIIEDTEHPPLQPAGAQAYDAEALAAACPEFIVDIGALQPPEGAAPKVLEASGLVSDMATPEDFCRQHLDHIATDDHAACDIDTSGLTDGPATPEDSGQFETAQAFFTGSTAIYAINLAFQVADVWYFAPNLISWPTEEDVKVTSHRMEVLAIGPTAHQPAGEIQVLVWEYSVVRPADGMTTETQHVTICDVSVSTGMSCATVQIGVKHTMDDGNVAEAAVRMRFEGMSVVIDDDPDKGGALRVELPEAGTYALVFP